MRLPLLLALILGSTPFPSFISRITATGGAITVSIADGPTSDCEVIASHLESLDIATGRERARTTSWSDILGELASGDLVVSNQRTAGATNLAIAVLARRDLRARFSCESTVKVDPRSWWSWSSADTGALGQGSKLGRPRSVFVRLELSKAACQLAVVDDEASLGEEQPAQAGARFLDGAVGTVRQGALTLSDSASPKGPSDPVLVASKGSTLVWKRALSRSAISGSCREQ